MLIPPFPRSPRRGSERSAHLHVRRTSPDVPGLVPLHPGARPRRQELHAAAAARQRTAQGSGARRQERNCY